LFKFFVSQKDFYKDDGFIRYFMGLVYENGGYLNDAFISYIAAIKAYSSSPYSVSINQDLIDDAYTSALKLGMNDRASGIKKQYPKAKMRDIPKGYAECILIDYNGSIPQKVENVISMAMTKAWAYLSVENISNDEMKDYQTVRSIGVSAFSKDYIQISFPSYKKVPNNIVSFTVQTENQKKVSYIAQDLGQIAQKNLETQMLKTFAKTVARAVIKYVIGKQVSAYATEKGGSSLGLLTDIASNVYTAATETADLRAWNTLPENILMVRLYLPLGVNNLTVNYFDSHGRQVRSENVSVNIKSGKKNFIMLKTLA
jgi:hypothetical protein